MEGIMIIILDKRAEAAAIKDNILKFIGENQPTFPEIHALYPDYKRTAVSNWLLSLRNLGFIDIVGEGKSYTGKKYVRISEKTFTEVITERLDENNQKRMQAYHRKKAEMAANPHARVYRMEDFKGKSKGNKTKINPWQGYTSFGEAI